jgi:hypothetical protein
MRDRLEGKDEVERVILVRHLRDTGLCDVDSAREVVWKELQIRSDRLDHLFGDIDPVRV